MSISPGKANTAESRVSAANAAAVTGLQALAWILADFDRAERLLALTGLTPDDLRAGAGDPAILAALLDFLAGHEPDLVACADALGLAPTELIRARDALQPRTDYP
jgi:hypothetical protein